MWKLPLKTIAVVSALSVGAIALADTADARPRHRGHGGAVAAAIAGIAIGAIIAETTSRRNSRYYDDRYYDDRRYYAPPPPPRHYRAPPPPRRDYSYGGPKPWTPAWYSYCTTRYRSFDPRSGTFQPYHGPRRMCR